MNSSKQKEFPVPDFLREAGYTREDLKYVVREHGTLIYDHVGKMLAEIPNDAVHEADHPRLSNTERVR